MIELGKTKLISTKMQSSKGNQLKWCDEDNWYKSDNNGYEGLSEYVVSHLLQFSNLKKEEFVNYEIEEIKYNDKILLGCKSKNFLKGNQRLVTLQRLYESINGGDLTDKLDEMDNIKDKCLFLVNTFNILTGINNFGEYLLKLLIIDALFLNEDRHFHNIAFIEENNKYMFCPIFDNGASLCSDTRIDYPLDENELRLINKVKSKTIVEDFDEQLNAMELLYKSDLEFMFTDQDIIDLMQSITSYDNKIKSRVTRILISQRQKYKEYFR